MSDIWNRLVDAEQQIIRLKDEKRELVEVLHRLEVSANTAGYCYDKRPENFCAALGELASDAARSREVLEKHGRPS